MYGIRVIRENKNNALVSYINVLHIFSKNLGGPLFKFTYKFFLIFFFLFYQIYKKEDGFLKSQEGPSPPSLHPWTHGEATDGSVDHYRRRICRK